MATYPWVADQFRRGLWALLGVVKGAPEVMEPPSLDGVAAGLVERVEGVGVHHGRELGKETVSKMLAELGTCREDEKCLAQSAETAAKALQDAAKGMAEASATVSRDVSSTLEVFRNQLNSKV